MKVKFQHIYGLILVGCLASIAVSGQSEMSTDEIQIQESEVEPIKMNRYTNVYIEEEEYKDNVIQWEQNVQQDSLDVESWGNYYFGTRYDGYLENNKKFSDVQQQTMDTILIQMGSNESLQNTFEYNHMMYVNGNNDVNYYPYLEKAKELDPANPELFDDMVSYHELTGNITERNSYCNSWLESGMVHPDALQYNRNVLHSLDTNAIIFTNGLDDTYPIWMIQSAEEIRTDVSVLNTSLIEQPEYTKRKLSELNMDTSGIVQAIQDDKLIETILANNEDAPIYFGLTIPKELVAPFKSKLYVTGLSLRYSPKPIDNLEKLESNWQKFDIGYLGKPHQERGYVGESEVLKEFDRNYLVPMLLLHRKYVSDGKHEEALSLELLLKRVSFETGQSEVVDTYFRTY